MTPDKWHLRQMLFNNNSTYTYYMDHLQSYPKSFGEKVTSMFIPLKLKSLKNASSPDWLLYSGIALRPHLIGCFIVVLPFLSVTTVSPQSWDVTKEWAEPHSTVGTGPAVHSFILYLGRDYTVTQLIRQEWYIITCITPRCSELKLSMGLGSLHP